MLQIRHFISFLPFPVELLPFVLDVDARDKEDQAHLCQKDQLLCHVNLLWRLQYKRWPCRGEQGGRQPGRAQNRARPSCLPHSGRTWGSTFVIQNTTNMYHLDHQRQMLPYSSTNGQYWQECILLSIIRLNFITVNNEILLCQVVHGVEPLVAKISLPTTLNCCRSCVVAQTCRSWEWPSRVKTNDHGKNHNTDLHDTS